MKTIDNYLGFEKTRRVIYLTAILSSLFLFIACSSSDDGISSSGTEYSISDIAGNWTATEATFNGVDVVAEGGTVTFVIQSSGRFTFRIERPVKSDMVFTGKLGFDEQWLAVEYDTDPGEYEFYDIDLDASRNNLHIGANSEFDFDDDGTDEFVIFFLEMIRN